jgi:hypothetical protein
MKFSIPSHGIVVYKNQFYTGIDSSQGTASVESMPDVFRSLKI